MEIADKVISGQNKQIHHLAAIMFTDIQGYTALMQEDEEQALKIRAEHRRIFNNTTKKYRGKILQYYGDGTLSIFDSAIDAVNCGIEMQLEFPIPVRIGIHTGDIIHTDVEVIGDGVNIASHIESISVVGSVFISGKVYDDIKNQKSIRTKFIGSFRLKNVREPVDVYAIANDGLVVPFDHQLKGENKDSSPHSSQGSLFNFNRQKYLVPGILVLIMLSIIIFYFLKNNSMIPGSKMSPDMSIAILPFSNLSNDQEQEYFSDGITEDLITHLSKIGDLNVISHASVMGYKNTGKTAREIARQLKVGHILVGSVRKHENQLRITAQLIDVKTNQYLWAATFDRRVDDIFTIQSEVAMEVAKALNAELTTDEEENINTSMTKNTEAYEYYLQGLYQLRSGTMEGLRKSLPLLQQAIRLDPEFARAYAEIAGYYIRQGAWRGVLTPEQARKEAIPYVMKALELNKNSKFARVQLATIKWWFEWDFEGAENEFLKGDSPGDYGFYLMLMGRFDEAEARFMESYNINPMDPHDRPHRGVAQFFLNDPEQAIKILQDGIMLYPEVMTGYHKLGKIYLNTGKYDEAIQILNKGMLIGNSRIPSFLGELAIAYFKSGQPDMSDEIIDELKKIESRGSQGSPAFFLAQIYAGIGDKESAFQWLQKSYEVHDVEMIWLKVEPQFKSLKRDPRFDEMLEKVGFQSK